MLPRCTRKARVRPDLERIHIEKTLSVKSNPRKDCIVKCSLDSIRVFCLPRDPRHPDTEHHETDRRACHIHLTARCIIPESPAGIKESLIVICLCKICHRTVEIHRANCVPLRVRLLPHRPVRLRIRRIIGIKLRKNMTKSRTLHFPKKPVLTSSARVHKIFREVPVFLLSAASRSFLFPVP